MRKRQSWRLWIIVALASVVALAMPVVMATSVSALAVPAAPKDIPILDQTGTLSDSQKRSLADKIAKERDATGNQIAILMVKSLDGQALEDYSIQVARSWGVGQKDRDSGVLLLVAKDDRRLRIEVGYGLEGALPDIRASHIITDRITPQFKQGKYYEGLDSGVDGIVAAIHGEKDPNLKTGAATQNKSSSIWSVIGSVWWLFLFVPIWLSSILGRTKSWWLGGVIGGVMGLVVALFVGFLFWGIASIVVLALLGLLFDKSVSANYQKAAKGDHDRPSWWAGGPWLGGGGPGGGNSGGFGGFSGGSFGGGGSSGSW